MCFGALVPRLSFATSTSFEGVSRSRQHFQAASKRRLEATQSVMWLGALDRTPSCCLRNSHVQTAKLQHSCFGCGVHSKCLPSRCDVTNGRYSGLPVGAAKEPLNRLDTPCVGGYHRLRLPVLESKKILLLLRRTFYFELLYDVARQESNRWSRFFVLRAAAHFPGF